MMWGLKQGLIGVGQRALLPSMVAVGPNRYLESRDFFRMISLAFILHVLLIAVASLLPKEEVTDIPVRALSFRIGGQDRIAAYGVPMGMGTTVQAKPVAAAPVATSPAAPGEWRAASKPTPKPAQKSVPKPVKQPKIVPITVPPEQRRMPVENKADTALDALPDLKVLTEDTPPAIAPTPQRFVREVGQAPQVLAAPKGTSNNIGQGIQQGAIGGEGNENVMTPQTAQQVRERYEQQISAWIQKHKLYPAAAAGREGKTIVRMRIDRMGYIRYYAIEESSGIQALDTAAIDMIRRANPVPAVPVNYPAGNLIEFLIPITFRVPQ